MSCQHGPDEDGSGMCWQCMAALASPPVDPKDAEIARLKEQLDVLLRLLDRYTAQDEDEHPRCAAERSEDNGR